MLLRLMLARHAKPVEGFTEDEKKKRAVFKDMKFFQEDAFWKEYIYFYEYFNPDNGKGLGASHQTGWTALVAKLIQQSGEHFF